MNISQFDVMGLLNPLYMAIILLISQWVKTTFKPKKTIWAVNIVALLSGVIVYFWAPKNTIVLNGQEYSYWLTLIITYFVTTSFYDVLMKPFLALMRSER